MVSKKVTRQRRPAPPAPVKQARSIERLAASVRTPEAPTDGRGIVQRPGRQLADGSRRGVKVARRMTFELPPHLATAISVRAAERAVSLSTVAAEVFAEAFGLGVVDELEATG